MTIHSEIKIICLYNLSSSSYNIVQIKLLVQTSHNAVVFCVQSSLFPVFGKNILRRIITVCVSVDKLLAERYQIQLMRRMPGV